MLAYFIYQDYVINRIDSFTVLGVLTDIAML